MGRLGIKRLKQRHLAQRLDVHWLESDGTVVTITAMRHCEKRQITDDLGFGPRKIDLNTFGSSLINASPARSEP
jgi:hypothetical protein